MSRTASVFGRKSPNKLLSSSLNATSMSSPTRNNDMMKSLVTRKLNKSLDLENIESEYIKNLQQQIYFLELEANYLREQAKKATDMHPIMTLEAEKMLQKLREFQAENDGLSIETKRQQSAIDIADHEKTRMHQALSDLEERHLRERRDLMDEIVHLKKERELALMDASKKQIDLENSREELRRSRMCTRNAEEQVELLKSQVNEIQRIHSESKMDLVNTRSELAEAGSWREECAQLRADKIILCEHVADLQKELSQREKEMSRYRAEADLSNRQLADMKLNSSLQSQRMSEMERLADSMRTVTRFTQPKRVKSPV